MRRVLIGAAAIAIAALMTSCRSDRRPARPSPIPGDVPPETVGRKIEEGAKKIEQSPPAKEIERGAKEIGRGLREGTGKALEEAGKEIRPKDAPRNVPRR